MVTGPKTNFLNKCVYPHDLFYAIQEIYSNHSKPQKAKLIVLRGISELVCKELAENIDFQYVTDEDYLIGNQVTNEDDLNITLIAMFHEIESLLKNGISTVVRLSSERPIDKYRLKRLLTDDDSIALQVSMDESEKISVSKMKLSNNKLCLEDDFQFNHNMSSQLDFNNLVHMIHSFFYSLVVNE
ncbi:hypothetical protein AAHB55_04645 [Bacillus cereus]